MRTPPRIHRSPGFHSWVSTVNLLVGSVIALIVAVFTLGVTCAHASDRVDALETHVLVFDHRMSSNEAGQTIAYSSLERRIETLQEQQKVTQNDVAWIRRELERSH